MINTYLGKRNQNDYIYFRIKEQIIKTYEKYLNNFLSHFEFLDSLTLVHQDDV